MIVAVLCCCATGSAQQAPSAVSPAQARAAAGLYYSARSLYTQPNEPARAGQLRALVGYLRSMPVSNLKIQRLFVDIDQSLGQTDQAIAAARTILQHTNEDAFTAERLVSMELSRGNTAEERIKILTRLLAEPSLPAAARSAAAVELARVHMGRGSVEPARKAIDQALSLDPLNPAAVLGRLELTKDPTAALRAKTMLALLENTPRNTVVAIELASLLDTLGLHELAISWLEYSWALSGGKKGVDQAPTNFILQYMATVMDAGKYDQALELFGPARRRLNTMLEFEGLWTEALARAGKTTELQKALARTERLLQSRQTQIEATRNIQGPGEKLTAQLREVALQKAWFYILAESKPLEALKAIRQARDAGAEGDQVELANGAAELLSGNPYGLKRLTPLMDKYPLAAAFLARYDFEKGDGTLARKALQAGFAQPRSGMAWRMLAAQARKQNIPIPPADGADEVDKLVRALPPAVRKMGQHPETFIDVSLQADKVAIKLDEPITVTVTLKNIGSAPVPLGDGAMLDNRVGLTAQILSPEEKTFTSLPVAIFAAPRKLAPGQTLSATVRADLGPLATYLFDRPLENMDIELSTLIAPYDRGQQIASTLPMVRAQPKRFRRMGMLAIVADIDSIEPSQYNHAIAALDKTLASGSLDDRLGAVRRIGSLIAFVRRTETGQAEMPLSLRKTIDKNVLLGLLGRALADAEPVVRAAAVTAMDRVQLDGSILNRLGAAIDDPAALVRFRMAQTIGSSRMPGSEQIIRHYLADTDPHVQAMAQAFQHYFATQKRSSASHPAGGN